jgi:hypothetical protein
MVISGVAIGDVERLHVERNRVVGGSYLDIEDLCYRWSKYLSPCISDFVARVLVSVIIILICS